VTYEDNQTALFHINFANIFFPVSNILSAFILTSNCHDGAMITPPQKASSWSWRCIFKYFETFNQHL